MIKKVKNTVPWTYVINDLSGEKFFGAFYEKESVISCALNGKETIIRILAGYIKKDIV